MKEPDYLPRFLRYPKIKNKRHVETIKKYKNDVKKLVLLISVFGLLKAFEDIDSFYKRGECKNPKDIIDLISCFVVIKIRSKNFTKEKYTNIKNYYEKCFESDKKHSLKLKYVLIN